jgi:hypothetical protein
LQLDAAAFLQTCRLQQQRRRQRVAASWSDRCRAAELLRQSPAYRALTLRVASTFELAAARGALAAHAALPINSAPIRLQVCPRFWRTAGGSAGPRLNRRMTTARAKMDLEAEAARNASKNIQLSTIAKALLA